MTTRAVLFDLDGTLVDSLEYLTDAFNHIRSAFSYPLLTAEELTGADALVNTPQALLAVIAAGIGTQI